MNWTLYRPWVLLGVFLSVFSVICIVDGDIDAIGQGGRCPQYEQALAERGLPVAFFSAHMWQESRCHPDSNNFNARTRDLSFGLEGLNLYEPATRAWYVANGFGFWNLNTVDGNLNGTVLLYNQCSTKPWVRPYGCTPPRVKAHYR